jgi:predicted PurR-regulated permease PerM
MPHGDSERERFTRLLFYAVVLLIGYLALQIVGPFLAAMTWAGVFAMVLYPVRTRLALRLGNTWAASLTTLLAVVIVVIPSIVVLTLLTREISAQVESAQASGFGLHAPERLQVLWESVRAALPVLKLPANPTEHLEGLMTRVASALAAGATSILGNAAAGVLQVFVMLFALFYFLRDQSAIVSMIRLILPFEARRRDRIMAETYELVVATVGSSFAVAITQGTLTGITMGLLGFSAPIFWGVITAFVSMLPVVGSGLIWGPAAAWLLLSGDIVRGIILIGVGVGVISMADNVLRPLLLSGRTTLHGLLVFISLLGGVAAFGFIGLVIGPVIMAAFGTLLGAIIEPDTSHVPPPDLA